MRFERLSGLHTTVLYVYVDDRYLGVVSEANTAQWLASTPSGQPLATMFDSAEAAARGLAAHVCGTAPSPHPSPVASEVRPPARLGAARLAHHFGRLATLA